jgi:hypothetical protein
MPPRRNPRFHADVLQTPLFDMKAPPGIRRGGWSLPVLSFGADDATGNADAGRDHQVKSGAASVRPDRPDLVPLWFAVAAFLRLGDHVGDVGRSAAHDVSPSLCEPPGLAPRRRPFAVGHQCQLPRKKRGSGAGRRGSANTVLSFSLAIAKRCHVRPQVRRQSRPHRMARIRRTTLMGGWPRRDGARPKQAAIRHACAALRIAGTNLPAAGVSTEHLDGLRQNPLGRSPRPRH